jgi:hypothetical protein
MFEPLDLVQLGVALMLTIGGYGFARVTRYLLRNQADWWHPEKVMQDVFLMLFLTPTFMGRSLLGLGEPGKAGTLSEAVMAAAVSFGLFASTAAVLALG